MELSNINIVADLSSANPDKQSHALISLIQQYSAGSDVQSYIQTIIQV